MHVNSKGYSVIEGLIALGILAVAGTLIGGFRSIYQDSSGFGLQRACKSYAQSIVNAVQQESYYLSITNYFPTGTTPTTRSLQTNPFTPTIAVPDTSKYWELAMPSTDPDDQISSRIAGQAPSLNNILLVQGSLRSLQAIYNNYPVRCALGAYAPLTSNPAFLPLPSSLKQLYPAATAQIQLNPYRHTTHATLCPPKIFISTQNRKANRVDANVDVFAPTSGNYVTAGDVAASTAAGETLATMSPTIGNTIALGGFTWPVTDLGVEMIAQVNYTYEGQAYNCSASQRFEYPYDGAAPPKPSATISANTSIASTVDPIVRDYCASGSNLQTASASFQVGYVNTASEGGVQFLCKDLSYIRTPTAVAPCLDAGGVPIVANQPVNLGASTFRLLDPAPRYPYSYTPNFGGREATWQPCDQMQQCGLLPANATAAIIDALNKGIVMDYNNLPAGCVLNFEAIAVDTAGNRSGTRTGGLGVKTFLSMTPTTYTSTGFGTENFAVRADEIYYPSCGNTPSGYYRAALGYYCPAYLPGYPNGYYTCGAGC